jgi:hypothetical protein
MLANLESVDSRVVSSSGCSEVVLSRRQPHSGSSTRAGIYNEPNEIANERVEGYY